MGWVSTLEDAIDRISDALHMLREDSVSGLDPITDDRKMDLVATISRAELVLSEARTYLDIATDPSIDMARQFEQAENEMRAVSSRLVAAERTCLSLKRQLDVERKRANDSEAKVRELTADRNRLDKKLADAMKENPDAIYDAFPPRSGTPGGRKNAK